MTKVCCSKPAAMTKLGSPLPPRIGVRIFLSGLRLFEIPFRTSRAVTFYALDRPIRKKC